MVCESFPEKLILSFTEGILFWIQFVAAPAVKFGGVVLKQKLLGIKVFYFLNHFLFLNVSNV